jgi:hypothetical protein
MVWKQAAGIGLLGCYVALGSGCSAFLPAKQTVNVTCVPADAVIKINGQKQTSPASIGVARDREVTVQCYKDGYATYQRVIEPHFNTTGKLDAVGTVLFLIPGVGLLSPGAYSLEETDLMVTLSSAK